MSSETWTWTLSVGRPGPGMWTDDVVMTDTPEMSAYQVAERWANAMGVVVEVRAGRTTVGVPAYEFWPGRWRAHEADRMAEGEGRMPMGVRRRLLREAHAEYRAKQSDVVATFVLGEREES